MKKPRMRKLTVGDRAKIRLMGAQRKELGLTYLMIARAFGVSKGRISQIVNNNYDELDFEE